MKDYKPVVQNWPVVATNCTPPPACILMQLCPHAPWDKNADYTVDIFSSIFHLFLSSLRLTVSVANAQGSEPGKLGQYDQFATDSLNYFDQVI